MCFVDTQLYSLSQRVVNVVDIISVGPFRAVEIRLAIDIAENDSVQVNLFPAYSIFYEGRHSYFGKNMPEYDRYADHAV